VRRTAGLRGGGLLRNRLRRFLFELDLARVLALRHIRLRRGCLQNRALPRRRLILLPHQVLQINGLAELLPLRRRRLMLKLHRVLAIALLLEQNLLGSLLNLNFLVALLECLV